MAAGLFNVLMKTEVAMALKGGEIQDWLSEYFEMPITIQDHYSIKNLYR